MTDTLSYNNLDDYNEDDRLIRSIYEEVCVSGYLRAEEWVRYDEVMASEERISKRVMRLDRLGVSAEDLALRTVVKERLKIHFGERWMRFEIEYCSKLNKEEAAKYIAKFPYTDVLNHAELLVFQNKAVSSASEAALFLTPWEKLILEKAIAIWLTRPGERKHDDIILGKAESIGGPEGREFAEEVIKEVKGRNR